MVVVALVLGCLVTSTAGFLLGQAAIAGGWQVIPVVAGIGVFIAVAIAVTRFAQSTRIPGQPLWRQWR